MGLDNIKDESGENRSLYEKNQEVEQEEQKVSAFDDDIEDLMRAKAFLEKYRAQEPVVFKSDFDKLYSDQQGNFEGDFNVATQDLQPFDISGIIGNARVAQGVNNTQTDELLGAIEDSEQKKDKKVGLGNKGLF